MLRKSRSLLAIFLFVILVFAIFLASRCRKEKEKDIRRVIVENICKAILDNDKSSEASKKAAKKVLDNWENRVADPEPTLLHAGYGRHESDRSYRFFLAIADEEFDVVGLVVREFHQAEPNVIVVEETYPVFPDKGIGHHQFFRFHVRQMISQRKNDKEWDDYAKTEATEKDLMYRRDEYPVIWTSLPNLSSSQGGFQTSRAHGGGGGSQIRLNLDAR